MSGSKVWNIVYWMTAVFVVCWFVLLGAGLILAVA